MLSKPSFKEELRRYLEERAADPKREHIGTTNRQIIERWKRRTDADDIWDPLSAACPHHLAPADLVKAVIRFRARAQSIVNRIYGVTVPAPDVVALRKKLVDQGPRVQCRLPAKLRATGHPRGKFCSTFVVRGQRAALWPGESDFRQELETAGH